MNRTSVAALIGTGGFMAAVAAILTWRFYGSMGAISVGFSLTLWVMAIICVSLALTMKSRVEDNRVGQDRSQLNPLTAALFLVLGKASAWAGAVIGGGYVGVASFVIPRAGDLVAASNDLPGVIASALGGIAMSAAGVYLERHCEVPPPQDGEAIQ